MVVLESPRLDTSVYVRRLTPHRYHLCVTGPTHSHRAAATAAISAMYAAIMSCASATSGVVRHCGIESVSHMWYSMLEKVEKTKMTASSQKSM